MNYMKCLLLVLTSILMFISLSLIALITAIKIKYYDLETITGSPPIDITLIVVAVALFLVSLMGVCGAVTTQPRLLKAFIFFIMLLIFIKIGIVAAVFTQQEEIQGLLRKLWDNINDKSRIAFQKVFSCCDIEGNHIRHASANDTSCFEKGGVTRQRKTGCIKVLLNKWDTNRILIAGVACGVVFTEIMIVVLSCLLICDDKDGSRTSRKTRVVPIKINVEPKEANEYSLNMAEVSVPSGAESGINIVFQVGAMKQAWSKEKEEIFAGN